MPGRLRLVFVDVSGVSMWHNEISAEEINFLTLANMGEKSYFPARPAYASALRRTATWVSRSPLAPIVMVFGGSGVGVVVDELLAEVAEPVELDEAPGFVTAEGSPEPPEHAASPASPVSRASVTAWRRRAGIPVNLRRRPGRSGQRPGHRLSRHHGAADQAANCQERFDRPNQKPSTALSLAMPPLSYAAPRAT
ncbi:hypothetical protein GCM10009811_02200 [Nostocoides veronense]|uniref:Uncharacterized protein n=1 Tax=Nostocoides veronense TaxID=330836 RepID=A0ABP4XJB0_9MICO